MLCTIQTASGEYNSSALWALEVKWRCAFTRLCSGKPYGVEGVHKLEEGVEFTLGSREIEIDHRLSREDFLSGRCFGRGGIPVNTPPSRPSAAKQFVPLKPKTLNSGTHSPHAQTTMSPAEKRGIALEPVNLVVREATLPKIQVREAYWTANWLVLYCYEYSRLLERVCG